MAGAAMGEHCSGHGVSQALGKPWEEANAAPARKTAGRRRLRGLRADYHCSICGTCLSLSDPRRVAGKAGFRVDPSASEHEVHSTFVRLASEPGRVAKAMQKLLDRKHRSAIERSRAMGAEAESARAAETRLAEAQARVRELTAGGALQALETRNDSLAARLEKAARDHQVECRRRAELEREVSELRSSRERALIELRDLGAECEALEYMLASRVPGEVPAAAGPSPTLDLGGRRIAYVGGRANLIGHFRDLIEQSNGELIHHDGGVDDSTGRLGRILGQADAVLCPVDCVSHGACRLTKRFRKRGTSPSWPFAARGSPRVRGGASPSRRERSRGRKSFRPGRRPRAVPAREEA